MKARLYLFVALIYTGLVYATFVTALLHTR